MSLTPFCYSVGEMLQKDTSSADKALDVYLSLLQRIGEKTIKEKAKTIAFSDVLHLLSRHHLGNPCGVLGNSGTPYIFKKAGNKLFFLDIYKRSASGEPVRQEEIPLKIITEESFPAFLSAEGVARLIDCSEETRQSLLDELLHAEKKQVQNGEILKFWEKDFFLPETGIGGGDDQMPLTISPAKALAIFKEKKIWKGVWRAYLGLRTFQTYVFEDTPQGLRTIRLCPAENKQLVIRQEKTLPLSFLMEYGFFKLYAGKISGLFTKEKDRVEKAERLFTKHMKIYAAHHNKTELLSMKTV